MHRAFALVIASVFGCCASTAMALGFGQVANATRLGQPLDFSVEVKLDAGESLPPECISADVIAGNNRIAPASVRARLVRMPRSDTFAARVTTTTRINEPVVTVALSLGCPPRLSHKFVSLLDPPLGNARQRVPAGGERSAAVPPDAVPATLPGGADIDAAAMDDAAERMRDRVRLEGLEARVARMGEEAQATQQDMAALQARVRNAEQARVTDPVIYGLTTLVVLLLGVIALLLWRQSRLQSERSWMTEADALSDLSSRPSDSRHPLPTASPMNEATLTSMRVLTEPPGQITVAGDPASAAAQAAVPAAWTPHELSTEELIDLEQQADFFVALGQEEAAIDLLMEHLRSSGGTSPMPYLKLLEIYRRRDESEAYERIRERFNRRFNAHAPAWAADPREGRELDKYTAVAARLQAAWPVASSAMKLLESLLFRRESTEAPFDLPAYEEMLFLYALARDLAEHEVSPQGVDLLLPLDNGDEMSSIMRAGDVTLPPPTRSQRPVDVELDLDHRGSKDG